MAAATTTDYEVASSDWTEVPCGGASVTLQLKSTGPIYVHPAAAKPDAAVTTGLVLTKEVPLLALADVDASDSIWLRARDDDKEFVGAVFG